MNINLHIERLVLEGVNIAAGEGHLLQNVVVTELTRILTDGGLSSSIAQGSGLPHISASGIQLKDGNNLTQIGQQIAQSVYGGLSHD
jgi:hypothetical protein